MAKYNNQKAKILFLQQMLYETGENHTVSMQEILDLEDHVDETERELQKSHIQRLTRGECTASAGMMFSDIISGLERVSDHATNIAFSLLDDDPIEHQKEERAKAVGR